MKRLWIAAILIVLVVCLLLATPAGAEARPPKRTPTPRFGWGCSYEQCYRLPTRHCCTEDECMGYTPTATATYFYHTPTRPVTPTPTATGCPAGAICGVGQ